MISDDELNAMRARAACLHDVLSDARRPPSDEEQREFIPTLACYPLGSQVEEVAASCDALGQIGAAEMLRALHRERVDLTRSLRKIKLSYEDVPRLLDEVEQLRAIASAAERLCDTEHHYVVGLSNLLDAWKETSP